MLETISIKDFALIEEKELDFAPGFTVLSGETGAGKSILLGALGLLLGDKADYDKIRQGQEEAELSALFSLHDSTSVKPLLTELNIPFDEELLIRRKINRHNKSKIYLNGVTVGVQELKAVGKELIVINAQGAAAKLFSDKLKRQMLDAFLPVPDLVNKTAEAFVAWQKKEKALQKAKQGRINDEQEKALLMWQQQEIAALAPQEGEWEEINLNYNALSHHQEILAIAEEIEHSLSKDKGMQEIIVRFIHQLSLFSKEEKLFLESSDILSSVSNELSEVALLMRSIIGKGELDEAQLKNLQERLQSYQALAKKYQIAPEDLVRKAEDIEKSLARLNEGQNIGRLQEETDALKRDYLSYATPLTQEREKAGHKLGQEVTHILHTLALDKAAFRVRLEKAVPSASGQDKVLFEVAMNVGSPWQEVAKAASGGELARINLALQVISSRFEQIPVLIFDEVDTGIGGKVADQVGFYLKSLAKNQQILAITHLPQVAVYGDQQVRVEKKIREKDTISEIRSLNEKERQEEIARMLGGGEITDLTLCHAKELIFLAKNRVILAQ